MHFGNDSNALTKDNMYITTKRGNGRLRKTTIGWKLLVKWKDGTENGFLLYLKESNPVAVAEFSKSRGISDVPAFC